MNDADIFAAGMGVTFLFLGGVRLILRERFLHGDEDDENDEA